MPNAAAAPAAQPTAAGSLDDMMLALQRADSLGNAGDAAKIAGMIQQAYPHHVQAALSMAPPMPAPALSTPVAMPGIGFPAPRASLMNPLAVAPPQYPDLPSPGSAPQAQAGAAQGAPGGGGSSQNASAPAGGAPSAPPTPGGLGKDLVDFGMGALRSFVGNLPGGNYLAAGMSSNMAPQGPVGAALSALGPVGGAIRAGGAMLGLDPQTQQNKAQIDAAEAQAAQQAPVGSTLGGMAGTGVGLVAGGEGLGLAAKGLSAAGAPIVADVGNYLGRGIEALGDTSGGIVKRFARSAVAGALGGGAQTVNDVASGHTTLGDAPAQAASNAIVGAIAGPTLGAAAAKGWDLLARKLTDLGILGRGAGEAAGVLDKAGLNGDELAKLHADAVTANNGQPVPLVAVLDAAQRAAVKKAAGDNPVVGNALYDVANKQATDAQTHVPDMLFDAGANTPATGSPTGTAGLQRVGDLEAAREQAMTDAMRNGPNPIANQRVALQGGDENVFEHPAVRRLIAGDPQAQEQIGNVVQALGNNQAASLPVDLLDSLRADLSKDVMSQDNSVARPARQAFNGINSIVRRNPDYAAALDQDAQHAAFNEGFGHGQTGKAIADIPGAQRLADNAKTGDAYSVGHGSGLLSGLASQAAKSPSGAQTVLSSTRQRQFVAGRHRASARRTGGDGVDQLGQVL